jgi:hypothetical protein
VRDYIAARVDELTVITPEVLDNFDLDVYDIPQAPGAAHGEARLRTNLILNQVAFATSTPPIVIETRLGRRGSQVGCSAGLGAHISALHDIMI